MAVNLELTIWRDLYVGS